MNQTFEEQMKNILKDQWIAFSQALQKDPFYALHFNSSTLNREEIKQTFSLTRQHPYDQDGFYFDRSRFRPGLHPWHEAGAYYIQEPAAMSVIPLAKETLKNAKLIIDLCAAPGGKTIQAATLAPDSLIIACEIDRKRCGILYENIERLGLKNVLVINTEPQKLISLFANCVDVIIADVPCSGEGMFRKDQFAIQDWSVQKIATCVHYQKQLLQVATDLIAPQGYLLYSTCTYNQQENEEQLDYAKQFGFDLVQFKRFYPHEFDGEGQTAAILQMKREKSQGVFIKNHTVHPQKVLSYYLEFCQEIGLVPLPEDEIHLRGEHLLYLPKSFPDLQNIPTLLPGIDLGTIKKNRFEPAHQLAKMTSITEQTQVLKLTVDDPRCRAYIRGESFFLNENENYLQGWTLVSLENFILGWGKVSNNQLKNHYPKGIRKQLPTLDKNN